MDAMGKEILSIADASELLSLSEPEIERLLEAGEIPGRRVGSHWFISRQRLLQFIAEGHPPDRAALGTASKSLPPKVLGPNWRCDTCRDILPPELAECPRCGTIRTTPLMGYRLPPVVSLNRAQIPKVN